MKKIGVVAIGRNEGERLKRCLTALAPLEVPVVYVDSGSNDGSVVLAQSMGAEVVELDTSISFTAARARNAGYHKLLASHPSLQYVQFVDSDCEIADNWFAAAVLGLESASDVAVVCGRRRERFPEASIYNRLIDLEWDTPVGEIQSCGGDSLIKVAAIASVGCFDESIAAGEEPEFCSRLLRAGYRLLRLDAEMTKHDAAMSSFTQWWRRHQRSGYGGLDVQQRFRVRLFDRELRSARVWTIGFLFLLIALGSVLGIWLGWSGCIVGVLIAILLWCSQAFRLSRYYHRNGFDLSSALHAGIVSMAIKWANLTGQLRYYRDRRHGRFSRLIEYKSDPQRSSNKSMAREAVSP